MLGLLPFRRTCQEGSSFRPIWQIMTAHQSLLFIFLSLSHPVVLMLACPPRPPAPLPSSLKGSNSETSPTHFLSLFSGFTFRCASFMSEQCPPEEMFCRVACPAASSALWSTWHSSFHRTNTARAIGTFRNFTAFGKGWITDRCVFWCDFPATVFWSHPAGRPCTPRPRAERPPPPSYWLPARSRDPELPAPQNLHTAIGTPPQLGPKICTLFTAFLSE